MGKIYYFVYMIGMALLPAYVISTNYRRGHSPESEEHISGFSWRDYQPVPQFNTSIPRNITALKGSTAFLECVVYNIGNKTVSWIREHDLHILTVSRFLYTADYRFSVFHQPNSTRWVLKIAYAQPRDSGQYNCQVNTHPVDPITYSVWLSVYVPKATIVGETERYVNRGSTINLTCIIEHHLQPKADNFWFHNNKMITYDSRESLVSVITDRGPVTKTILLIHDASDSASGTYSCIPSPHSSVSASARIHILNGETPAAMQANMCRSLKSSILLPFSVALIAMGNFLLEASI